MLPKRNKKIRQIYLKSIHPEEGIFFCISFRSTDYRTADTLGNLQPTGSVIDPVLINEKQHSINYMRPKHSTVLTDNRERLNLDF